MDLLIPTHPDDDHVQGLIAVAESLPVRAALDGGLSTDDGAHARLLDALKRRGVSVLKARRGQRVSLGGGAYLEVLHPTDRRVGGRRAVNNDSVVLRVVYGKARVLLTGDAEEEAERDLVASRQDLSADVLKVGHHGSRWSSGAAFLAAVQPRIAVVSAGADNAYGHPHPEVLERLLGRGVQVFRTDQQGAIVLETDGVRIQVRGTKPPAVP